MKLRFFLCISAAAILAVPSLPSRSEVSPKATSTAAAPIATLSANRISFICNLYTRFYCRHGSVTLKNTGNAALDISRIGIVWGPHLFSETNNCGRVLLPGKWCTIYVLWNGINGVGSLGILDNVGPGHQTVMLYGEN